MKKYSKNLLALLLCLAVVLAFSACGGTESGSGATATPDKQSETTEAPAENTDEPEQTPEESAPAAPTEEPVTTEEPGNEGGAAAPTVAPGNETYADGIASEDATEYAFKSTGGSGNHTMLEQSIGIQFFATVGFNALSINCPSYSDNLGTLEYTLYAWQGNYDATLASTPLATAEFVDYADNSANKMTFDTLPDGEYLLYLTTPDASQQVGIWGISAPDTSDTRMYVNDFEAGFAPEMKIFYVKTPNTMFGPLSESGL